MNPIGRIVCILSVVGLASLCLVHGVIVLLPHWGWLATAGALYLLVGVYAYLTKPRRL